MSLHTGMPLPVQPASECQRGCQCAARALPVALALPVAGGPQCQWHCQCAGSPADSGSPVCQCPTTGTVSHGGTSLRLGVRLPLVTGTGSSTGSKAATGSDSELTRSGTGTASGTPAVPELQVESRPGPLPVALALPLWRRRRSAVPLAVHWHCTALALRWHWQCTALVVNGTLALRLWRRPGLPGTGTPSQASWCLARAQAASATATGTATGVASQTRSVTGSACHWHVPDCLTGHW